MEKILKSKDQNILPKSTQKLALKSLSLKDQVTEIYNIIRLNSDLNEKYNTLKSILGNNTILLFYLLVNQVNQIQNNQRISSPVGEVSYIQLQSIIENALI